MTDQIFSIEKIFALLPLLMMNGDSSSRYLMLFIYLIVPICQWIYTKIILYWEKDSYIIYEFSDVKIPNLYYGYVSFILEKHNLIKKMKHIENKQYRIDSNDIIMKNNYGNNMHKTHPIIIPTNNSDIFLEYDNSIFKIIHSYTNNKEGDIVNSYFKIFGDIPKFLKYLEKIQIEKVQTENKSINYKYYRYSSAKFVANTINVNKSFDNVFLDNAIKSKIIHNIEYFLNNKEKYDKLGIQRKLGYLFYGKPGNGKTSMAIAIAKTYNKNIYKIDLAVTKDVFLNQIINIPQGSVVLFEDVDTFAVTHHRENDDEKEENKLSSVLLLSDILEVLDGYYYLSECIIIMTTNHIEKLDSAFIRPGRIDHKIELCNVSKEQIVQIIKYFYGKNIHSSILNKISNIDISTSKLINTVILSHMDDYEYVINYLCSK